MRLPSRPTALLAGLVAALAVAGCGGDSNDDGADAGQGSAPTTVSVASVDDVGDVLVDGDGAALYTADQESDGSVRCTRSCTKQWIPVTLTGMRKPTGSDDVSGKLAVVERPDGARQLTYDGKPVYRFAQDGASGDVNGDGLSDDFDGRRFSWQVVTTGGAANESQDSGGGSYGY